MKKLAYTELTRREMLKNDTPPQVLFTPARTTHVLTHNAYAAHSQQNPLRHLTPTRVLLTPNVHMTGPELKQFKKAFGVAPMSVHLTLSAPVLDVVH